MLELIVVELLHALSEKCRIMIREDLAYIQCQATNGLAPVISGISLECWIDDR
uniref:Protein phosphatase 2a, regulatory subunit, putative n=1 Tax=Arundo donax TaxID=35708 RepID=A0A0A8XS99_ARUDO